MSCNTLRHLSGKGGHSHFLIKYWIYLTRLPGFSEDAQRTYALVREAFSTLDQQLCGGVDEGWINMSDTFACPEIINDLRKDTRSFWLTEFLDTPVDVYVKIIENELGDDAIPLLEYLRDAEDWESDKDIEYILSALFVLLDNTAINHRLITSIIAGTYTKSEDDPTTVSKYLVDLTNQESIIIDACNSEVVGWEKLSGVERVSKLVLNQSSTTQETRN